MTVDRGIFSVVFSFFLKRLIFILFYSIGAPYRTRQEIQCLPYTVFTINYNLKHLYFKLVCTSLYSSTTQSKKPSGKVKAAESVTLRLHLKAAPNMSLE